MSAGTSTEDWTAANQRALMAELGGLAARLRGESPNDTEISSALDVLCARFGLSAFERRLILFCAGMELDGDFGNRCAAAPGSGGNPGLRLVSPSPLFPKAIGMRSPATRRYATGDWSKRSATVRWSRAVCRSTSGFSFSSPALPSSMSGSLV